MNNFQQHWSRLSPSVKYYFTMNIKTFEFAHFYYSIKLHFFHPF